MMLLCLIGLHRWERQPDELRGYGMGLEWHEVYRCARCRLEGDQVRRAFLGHKDWRTYPETEA